jgi:hypothetical protein
VLSSMFIHARKEQQHRKLTFPFHRIPIAELPSPTTDPSQWSAIAKTVMQVHWVEPGSGEIGNQPHSNDRYFSSTLPIALLV